jgi:hypothetical protein
MTSEQREILQRLAACPVGSQRVITVHERAAICEALDEIDDMKARWCGMPSLLAERDAAIGRMRAELDALAGCLDRAVHSNTIVHVAGDPLKVLGAEVVAINAANGWRVLEQSDWPLEADAERVNRIGTALCLIHSEVSEALEALRKLDRPNFDEEMADVLIRVLDVSTGLGIDLDAEVRKKLEKNRGRGRRHGGKAV